ncbi:hypothetical protein [Kribbella sp. C-35]|uniref:hypothetical protein n=1 Tax=Kribbella sp. C-35 TaxID=2789276 RepID=UPI00397D8A95
MPKFSLIEGDETGHIFAPANPVPGDHLLIVERELLDPTTRQKVGTITAALTFMKIIPPNDALVLGIAEHHLDDSVKHPARAGVISVQGSFRFSDGHPAFSVVGGTGGYSNSRGTVTLDSQEEKFNYDVTY